MNSLGRTTDKTNEQGSALMQVIIVGSVVAIIAYFLAQLMVNNDRNSIRMIHRNDNLSLAQDLSDYVNSANKVRDLSNVVDGQYP